MTDIAKLKKDKEKYTEQLIWLEEMSNKVKDNLFNVKAKIKEVGNG